MLTCEAFSITDLPMALETNYKIYTNISFFNDSFWIMLDEDMYTKYRNHILYRMFQKIGSLARRGPFSLMNLFLEHQVKTELKVSRSLSPFPLHHISNKHYYRSTIHGWYSNWHDFHFIDDMKISNQSINQQGQLPSSLF